MKIISCDHDVMYLKLYIDEMDKCNTFFTEITWKASLFVGSCGMVEQKAYHWRDAGNTYSNLVINVPANDLAHDKKEPGHQQTQFRLWL